MQDRLGFHHLRVSFLLPFSIIIHLAMLVQGISDTIYFSLMHLVDIALVLVWFALALPAYIGFKKEKAYGYMWNWYFMIYMIVHLISKAVVYASVSSYVSIGLMIAMGLLVLVYAFELLYYRQRKKIFIG